MSPARFRKLVLALAVIAVAVAAGLFVFLRAPAYEVTVFFTSDTHYGLSPAAAEACEKTIDAMNRLPGTAYPKGIGGVVGTPRGVAVLGDLLNDASGSDAPAQWRRFSADFGVNGEGRLRFPAYELPGNHDGGDGGIVRQGIRERNRIRPDLIAASADGMSYSWDWGPVHFVSLGLYAGSAGDAAAKTWAWRSEGTGLRPGGSLEFLIDDLARHVGRSGRPVVLLQHYGWDVWGLSWWSDREREALRAAVKGYDVIGIFYGHSHVVMRVDLDGYPAFCVGAAQADPLPGSFFAVRIRPKEMDVAERKADDWGYVARVKLRGRTTRND